MRMNFKLLALILPTLVFLLLLGALRIQEKNNYLVDMTKVSRLILLATQNSEFVHQLQKERDISAGYIGSKGEKFADLLKQQQKSTDAAKSSFDQFLSLNQGEIVDEKVLNSLKEISSLLTGLAQTRSQIESLQLSTPEAIDVYTEINQALLSTTPLIAHASPDAALTRILSAFNSLLEGKEQAGIERAIGNDTFARQDISEAYYTLIVSLIAYQDTNFSSFISFAEPEQINHFNEILAHEDYERIVKLRFLINNYILDQPVEEWFNLTTVRIEQLKTLEDQISTQLLSLSETKATSARSAFWLTIILLCVVVVFSIGLTWFLVKNINLQVNSVRKAIRNAIEQNDLTSRCNIYSKDEIGEIGVHINSLLALFSDAVSNISEASVKLAIASDSSSSIVAGNADRLDRQHQNTLQMVSALEQMTASVNEVAQNTVDASGMANAASEQVRAGEAAVQESVTNIEKIAQNTAETAKSVGTLNERSQDISKVLEVIKGIAEQTNLLALNAAIEAARAGEQGRGFAVVADEVRALAQRTQESTVEIEQIVNEFQHESESAFQKMELSRTQVNESVSVVSKVQAALDEIMNNVSLVNDKTQQIATAAEQQVSVSHEIALQAQEIGDLSQAAATGGEEIAKATHEQAQQAEQLKQLAARFNVG